MLGYRTVCLSCPVCLSVLSVTLVYCGQTVRWIKMPVGIEVGIGLGHIVLDGNPAPPKKGAQQPPLSTSRSALRVLLWLNSIILVRH